MTKTKTKGWTSFHNHTIYSTLDGHGSPEKYAERAREMGSPALAITDHGNVHGWLPFYDACKEAEIKPILGMEAYQARKTRHDTDAEELSGGSAEGEWGKTGPHHLTLLARNMQGYKNIIKLSSKAYLEGYYGKPRIDFELLEEHGDGLIIGSGCLSSVVQQALMAGDYDSALKAADHMQQIVGRGNFFVELHDHGLEEQARTKDGLLRIAKALDAPLCPTGDCHYVNLDDHDHHDTMLAVGTGALKDQEKRFRFAGPEFYLKSYDEMLQRFEPEWLHNTLVIAESVDLELDFGEFYFPRYPDVPEGHTAESYLEELTWEGLKERYGEPLPKKVIDQAQHELGVVSRMGFPDYFLVVWDLVNWAKNNDIRVGFGRGSAAGSIVSYALRITNLDPLRFGLLFERFLVEGRKSMPDIDLDFDDRYRDRVIDYARSRYGADRVSHICTFNSIGAKQAIQDAGRVLGYEFGVRDRLSKMVPPPVLGVARTLQQALDSTQLRKAYAEDKDARRILDSAKGLEGLIRQPGIHPAGVVIAQGPVMDFVPVMRRPLRDGTPGPVVTQWEMYGVERNGLLKIDFLGLRNLGVLDMALKTEKERSDEDLQVPREDARV
jgi:DNA polymerase-3 subunit alpha